MFLKKKINRKNFYLVRFLHLGLAFVMSYSHIAAHAEITLLNVSYDVTRELFKEINPLFIAEWKKKNTEDVVINQSHGGSSTFTQRGIGDVLATFENEVQLLKKELGDNFDVVYPSISILADSPVAVVDKVVDRKGTIVIC